MATPSIWLQNLLLKIKWVYYVAQRKGLKMRFIAMSMVS